MRVIQISDTHLCPGHTEFAANFAAVAAHIRARAPDLVIHSGDITREAPDAPDELAHARAELDALGIEVLTIPGNHDIGDNPGDGGYMPKVPVSAALLEAYTGAFGPDHWQTDRGAWRLVGLNSLLFLSGLEAEAAQWEWLEGALGGHERIALFLHKPLFLTPEDTPADPPFRYVPEAPRRRLAEMIERAGVRLVGCGHVHQARSHLQGATAFVWAPATAFVMPDRVQPRVGEKVCGLVEYDLGDDGGVHFETVRPEGILDQDITQVAPAYP